MKNIILMNYLNLKFIFHFRINYYHYYWDLNPFISNMQMLKKLGLILKISFTISIHLNNDYLNAHEMKTRDLHSGAGSGSSVVTESSLLSFRCSSRLVQHLICRCTLFYLYFGGCLLDELYPLAGKDFAFSSLNLFYIHRYLISSH
jgi:hypothetical protein